MQIDRSRGRDSDRDGDSDGKRWRNGKITLHLYTYVSYMREGGNPFIPHEGDPESGNPGKLVSQAQIMLLKPKGALRNTHQWFMGISCP